MITMTKKKKKKNSNLDQSFWEDRYINQEIGWDIGHISTPIKTYIDQLTNYNLKILIPGAGNSYEAEYLWKKGFKHVYLLDIAKAPLENFKIRVPNFPEEQIIHSDFFKLKATFDLVIEHTFFCAINPNLRIDYANKMNEIIKKEGKLVGLFFNFELTNEGPPFGGCKTEYIRAFSKYFKIKTLEPAFNSIKPRHNRELFFIFEKTSKA
jgi:hypothetical protein